MEQARQSARNTELLIRIVSILVILAGGGILIHMLSIVSRETIALLSGAVVGILIASPCAVLVTLATTRGRQAQQSPMPELDIHEQQRREMVIDLEHRIAEHVLDGSWPVVMPHDPSYEPWKVIKPRELVVMAGREVRR
jgi:hypothetical protein